MKTKAMKWLFLLVCAGWCKYGHAAEKPTIIDHPATYTFPGIGAEFCVLLLAEKGTVWNIQVAGSDQSILAGGTSMKISAAGCDAEKPKVASTGIIMRRKPHLTLVSGGGAYGIWIYSSTNSDSYRLDVALADKRVDSGFVMPGKTVEPWRFAHWAPKASSTTPTPKNASYRAGTVFHDCAEACPSMVVVPAGSFLMGSPSTEEGRNSDEGPQHKVNFAHAFAVGRYEVTFDEYDACVADGGCSHKADDHGWGRGRRPVIDVNWSDAQEYVRWLSARTGQAYNLLSESEWEYMARAGTTTPWNTGSAILTDDANILDAFKQPVPVGGFAPNAFGVYDVHGNVAEWVQDCHDVGYFGVPNDGAGAMDGSCEDRVIRGGGFSSEPVHVRSAARGHVAPDARGWEVGFRVARSL